MTWPQWPLLSFPTSQLFTLSYCCQLDHCFPKQIPKSGDLIGPAHLFIPACGLTVTQGWSDTPRSGVHPCAIICAGHGRWSFKEHAEGASLVAQWLRIHLPVQGTGVQSLVWEDPTCHGATKPMCHNYWAHVLETLSHNYWSLCTLEPVCCNYWAHMPQLLKPVCLEPMLRNKRSHRNEKPAHRNEE